MHLRLVGCLAVALSIIGCAESSAKIIVRDAKAGSSQDVPSWSVRDCPVACVIEYSPGGLINAFRRSALQLKVEGRRMIIDGECVSACTMAASLARPNVCITKRAVLQFHKMFTYTDSGKFLARANAYEEYDSDIADWVREHGGFPGETEKDDKLLTMTASDAKAFFPLCEGN